jgi:hypothetical protein
LLQRIFFWCWLDGICALGRDPTLLLNKVYFLSDKCGVIPREIKWVMFLFFPLFTKESLVLVDSQAKEPLLWTSFVRRFALEW